MNYWIFTVKNHKGLTGEEIFAQRMKDCFWGLAEKTPNRTNLSDGDMVVFYIAVPKMVFGGTATLASPSFKLNDSHKKQYGHEKETYLVDYGVLLKDIVVWRESKSAKELVPSLRFIENKEFWGGYLQGGIRQISEDDFKTIIGERSLIEQIVTSRDIESQAEFALETHLEEFIYENWGKINWGSKLNLYKTDEQDGRQFPATASWSIDFLAIDKSTNDLVVIELKKGKTSDATVGQILRYISWIKENVANKDQNVRGIIIAKKIDDALKYAIRDLDYIEIKTYNIDFQLSSFKETISSA